MKTMQAAVPLKLWLLCIVAGLEVRAHNQSAPHAEALEQNVASQDVGESGTAWSSSESTSLLTRTERSYAASAQAEPPSRPKNYWDDPHFRPSFDNSTERNVTAQLGKSAFLHCRIRQLGDRTVSWVRQHDLHILTVGTYTYTSDQRFKSIHLEASEDWTLEITYAQRKDAGVYECQVSTEPKMSLNVSLSVVAATARIMEGRNLYIQSGNTINLTCVVTENTTPSVYVFWYHDSGMINYDGIKNRVFTEPGHTTISRLQVLNANTNDSGNYSCVPTYAESTNITVHVLNGEKPAAMQHGRQGNFAERSLSSLQLVLLVFFLHEVFSCFVVRR
ncbi:hemicentin-2-like [Ornithodoros turicata]|uniref:hemicentin-2-like n=1 Tax=Ornithodoros turicata TaxID=34597 RepID=UPI003139D747